MVPLAELFSVEPAKGCAMSLLEELSSKGFRITAQRQALVETLEEAQEHLDAATLLELARKRNSGINRATVYRTIELLKKLRLIDELDLMHMEGEKHYYEVRTARDHLHLACLKCGAIIEFAGPALDRLKDEISRQNNFEITTMRVEAGGRCQHCG